MLGGSNSVICSSAIYKQNVSISLRLIDSVQRRRGLYFMGHVRCLY